MADARTVETYRSLRETVKHAPGAEPIKSVLIVDVDRKSPSEVARRLAAAFGVAGDNCVLIDANFRAAGGDASGLSDLIRDPDTAREFEAIDGLTIVGAGTAAEPDLLSSRSFSTTLAAIVEQYDYAIVTCDGYPASADAIALGPLVDAVILVISAGVTGREPAIRARDALDRVGARILGMVVVERPRRWF